MNEKDKKAMLAEIKKDCENLKKKIDKICDILDEE